MAALRLESRVLTPSEAHEAFRNASVPTPAKLKAAKILATLLKNIVAHPTEAKYRTLKNGNPKLATHVWPVRGSRDILLRAGFQLVDNLFEDNDFGGGGSGGGGGGGGGGAGGERKEERQSW